MMINPLMAIYFAKKFFSCFYILMAELMFIT